jgi:intracellular sulfur oxidation DsrE/DsrF family protein
MTRSNSRTAALFLTLTGCIAGAGGAEPQVGSWVTPTVPGFGAIHEFERPAYMPDKAQIYKVVFTLPNDASDPHVISPALDRAARAVNLYVYAGVPLSRLKFVVVADRDSVSVALDDAHYLEKFGTKNPNLPLIALLRQVGVDVVVCGQSVARNKYEYAWIDKSVTIALSAVTTVTSLQQRGYGLMPL